MRVVVDVSPLSHPRTGIGNYIRGSLAGMAAAAAGRHQLVAQPGAAIVGAYRFQRLGAAKHRAAERLVGERRFEQMVVDDIVRRFMGFAQFGQDDDFLAP